MQSNKYWENLWNENQIEDFQNIFFQEADKIFSIKVNKINSSRSYYATIHYTKNNDVVDSIWLYDYEITTRFCDLAGKTRIRIKRDEVEKFILNYLAKKFPEYKKDYVENIMKTKFNEEYDLNV